MVQTATADAWCVSDCIKVPWSTGVASPLPASHPVFAAPLNGPAQPGAALEVEKLAIKWKAGERGNKMAKGGFGWVYFGAYDASEFAGAAHTDVKVVVKMPTDDEDAIAAFEREGLINERIASFGGIQGAAEFLGTLDLSAIDASLLPAAVGGRKALVWRQVEGKTLDTYFDRRGGMSPMLAKTLDVRASEPVNLPTGELSYIKTTLAVKVMGEVLLTLADLHDKKIIHRDLKPQNLMLAENDAALPLRIIDMGSALIAGQEPIMDDYTEIYAPPEAPQPNAERPDAYDIYTVGIIGLRCLMPALLAGEAGVQTLGKVTCAELPAAEYDFAKWCSARANDKAAAANDMPLNSECQALMQLPDLYALLVDMLAADPTHRPSARECLQRLGAEWAQRLDQRRFPLGREIPLLWRRDVDLAWGEEGGAEGQGSGEGGKGKSISPSGADTAAAKVRGEGGMGGVGGVLGEGQVCVVERSDGKLKFAVVKSRSASGRYDVTVEPSGAFQKDLAPEKVGRILL
eukprot:Tamp_06557.p1 GENE.Tamp_06557~~Tamp_06557.p1  ORF type:complete len:583 (-),score=95.28 Tamp_06557:936-2486(-)